MHDGLHSVCIDRQGGDEVIAVNDSAATADFDRQPVDFERIFAVTDRNFTEPLEMERFKLVALVFAPALELWQFNAVQVLVDEFVRAGLAVEDEVTVGLFENLLADGLVGVEVVAEVDRLEALIEGAGMLSQQAFDGFGFAVLFFVAVLRGDELHCQRQDLLVLGRHQHCHRGVVMIFGAGGFMISRRALITMDFIRAVKLCAIDCDECSVIENLEISVNLGMLQKQPGGDFKGTVERGRFHSIELGADVIVTGDALHAVERAAVVARQSGVHDSLVVQK